MGVLSSTAPLNCSLESTCCARSVAMYLRDEAMVLCETVHYLCGVSFEDKNACRTVMICLGHRQHKCRYAHQGATEFTRMPSLAHSHARVRVSWFIAAVQQPKHPNTLTASCHLCCSSGRSQPINTGTGSVSVRMQRTFRHRIHSARFDRHGAACD